MKLFGLDKGNNCLLFSNVIYYNFFYFAFIFDKSIVNYI